MKRAFGILFLVISLAIHLNGKSIDFPSDSRSEVLRRASRQLDLNLGANHEKDEGTDVFAELKAQLWESANKKTRIQGSAEYSQHFGGFRGDGNAKIGGSINVRHEYRKK